MAEEITHMKILISDYKDSMMPAHDIEMETLKKGFPELDIHSIAFHLSGQSKPEEAMTREKMLERIEAGSPSGNPSENEQAEIIKSDEKPELDENLAVLFKQLRKTVKEKGMR